MTVLRREATPSYRASQGRLALSQSCDACPPDRACLHPSTATSKFIGMVVMLGRLSGVRAQGGPDEASELARDGDGDLGAGFSFCQHAIEAAV